jgi:peptidoglycan/xylan/chitin deacetylase (PgdA/CDA1 family)
MTAPVVTLTFDNGPTPGVTEPVLDLLKAHAVPATFFAIGRQLITRQGAALGERIVAEGHRLGGHTFTHSVQFGAADDSVVADELARTTAAVEAVAGEGLLFRPYGAGGVIDERLMSTFGAEALCDGGYTCVLWNVLPGDWRDPGGWVEAALAGIVQQRWPVVVLHDTSDAALARLDHFLGAAAEVGSAWSQSFPDECTPIRDGSPTSSFATLLADT